MSGSVHNIDAIVVPTNCRVLRKNGNPPLFLLIIGIHDSLSADVFAVEGARLLQQAVDERGFAMIHVGNNRDIT